MYTILDVTFCRMNKPESMRGAHIHFHRVGLSGSKTEVMKKIKDEEVKFPVDTLSNLIKTYGHEGVGDNSLSYQKFL